MHWLMWNDKNCVYRDADSLTKFGLIITKEEDLEILLRQVEANKLVTILKVI